MKSWSTDEGINVALADMSESVAHCLSSLQQADVESLSNEKRRHERRLVYSLINIYIGEGLLLRHEQSGAPYLVDSDGSNLQIGFSISHCRSGVAICFGLQRHIGIDIEDPTDKISRVVDRFMSEREKSVIADEASRLAAWTVKEAAFKAAGVEGITLADIEIDPQPAAVNRWVISIGDCRFAGFTSVDLSSGRTLALVWKV